MSRPWYCDDWSCPSKWSCARAFARSQEYWAFDLDDVSYDLRKGPRNPHRAECADYRRDIMRPWLADAFTTPVSNERPATGFRPFVIEGGRA